MEIYQQINGWWEIDHEAMRAIITGEVEWKRCYSCEKGLVWVDGDNGVVVSNIFVEDNKDKDPLCEFSEFRFYQDLCEDCKGTGFLIVC